MKILGLVLISVLLSFVISYPAYLLWNSCLVGAIDGVKEVTWLQTWGIMIMINIMTRTNIESK